MNTKFKPKPVPDFERVHAPVKFNASAILREDAMYKRKQESEANLIKAYEAELRDSTEYYRWQTEMRAKDEEDRLALVEQRRNESVASAEEAKRAKERTFKGKQRVAAHLKSERKLIVENMMTDKVELAKSKKVMAGRVRQVRDTRPQIEKSKVSSRNRKVRNQIRLAQKEAERALEKERKLEATKRADKIRQIRALERVHVKTYKAFDPTSTGGHMLLNEMSIVEMTKRLSIQDAEDDERLEIRRKKILEEKREKEKKMQKRIEVIRRARKAAKEASIREHAAAKARAAREAEIRQRVVDDAKIKLMEKLELVHKTREDEAARLHAEEQELMKKKQFLGAEKNIVEAKVHEQLALGAEREAKTRQEHAQYEEAALERIRVRERKILENNIKKERRRKKLADEAAREKISEAKRLCTEFTHKESQRKKSQAAVEKARYKNAVSTLKTINPYATAMSTCPRNVLKNMSEQEMVAFFEGREHSMRKTLRELYSDSNTFDRFQEHSESNVMSVREGVALITAALAD